MKEVITNNLDMEQAAVEKFRLFQQVTMGEAYAHGFTRRGPFNIKRGAGDDITEADIDATLDRLPSILRYGIVCRDYARKIGIPYSRNYGNRMNNRNVSIIDSVGNPIYVAFDHAREGATGQRETGFVSSQDVLAIAINPAFPMLEKRDPAFPGSSGFRPIRVAPRFFLGLFIDSQRVREKTVNEIVTIMTSVSHENSGTSLPIFDMKYRLLWPKIPNVKRLN